MTRDLRSESGQVIPFVGILLLAALLGICALAIDVGFWFKASRHAQNVADAAALAAVQDLPNNPAAATADAVAYAAANNGALTGTPQITSSDDTNDTVSVRAEETAPSFFARVFGIDSATVHATATAEVDAASTLEQNDWLSTGTGRPLPFALPKQLAPTAGCGCFGKPITLCFGPACAVAGGQFGLVDLANSAGGTPPGEIAGWINGGYPGSIGLGWYGGITGNKTMPQMVRSAMDALVARHPTIVLPVYDATNGVDGAGMQYHVIGWAAFKLASFDANGNETYLGGSFETLETKKHGNNGQFFGVGHVKLTK